MLLPEPYDIKGWRCSWFGQTGFFWGIFWSIRDSSPMTQCRKCSVAPVSVICVRWVLSWCHKLPVKKREQYDLDDAVGCYSAEKCSWRKKFKILSITYFCCPYTNCPNTLSGLWGHKWVLMALFSFIWSPYQRLCLSSSLCLQSHAFSMNFAVSEPIPPWCCAAGICSQGWISWMFL